MIRALVLQEFGHLLLTAANGIRLANIALDLQDVLHVLSPNKSVAAGIQAYLSRNSCHLEN